MIEMSFDIGEDISFVFNSEAVCSGQNNQPECASLFAYDVEPIIGHAELLSFDTVLGKEV